MRPPSGIRVVKEVWRSMPRSLSVRTLGFSFTLSQIGVIECAGWRAARRRSGRFHPVSGEKRLEFRGRERHAEERPQGLFAAADLEKLQLLGGLHALRDRLDLHRVGHG